MTTPPISIEDFKEHLNKSLGATDDDVELTRALKAATNTLEKRIGAMVIRDVKETVYAEAGILRFGYGPLVEINWLAFDGATVDVAALELDAEIGLAVKKHGQLHDGAYEASYKVGRAEQPTDVDEDLQEATLIVASHLWETQRGKSARPGLYGEDPAPTGDEATRMIYTGFALPRRAMELIAPHRMPVIA